MLFIKSVLPTVMVILLQQIPVQSEANWSYDLISINVENQTPDIAFVDLQVTRVARGVFSASGSIDIKRNITDDMSVSVNTYYSLTGGQNFAKSIFYLPDCTLSDCFNKYYKEILMEDLLACSDNSPNITDTFEPPLTPRCVRFSQCLISTDNLPTRVKSGYYKIVISFKNQVKALMEFLIHVQEN